MPGGDRTGPSGEGPITGRGLGYCRGNDDPGISSSPWNPGRGFGRGFQRGPGFGRGRGRGFRFRGGFGYHYNDLGPDVSEKTLIENEIRILKDQLAALEDRLSKSKGK
ncbi:MAG: DUF5320 domain-containing protein [Bacteroidota bacterium]